jgi:HSP20 family protein
VKSRGGGRGLDRWSAESWIEGTDYPRSPLALIRRLIEQMDRFVIFSTPFGGDGWFTRPWPAVEVFERGGQLVVRADVPGTRSEDLRVRIDDGFLRIEVRRRHDLERQESDVYRSERSYGVFQRNIQLPAGIDEEAVQARFDNGVLEVTMPSPRQSTKGRVVPIRSSGDGAAMRS